MTLIDVAFALSTVVMIIFSLVFFFIEISRNTPRVIQWNSLHIWECLCCYGV